ncbi:DNA mismatch repair protein MutT [Pseudooceanicola sp. 216_PA32_1]|uniref:DNA mismatch repair protein MutT n=1 Tax=Pseudooceanicola pacificus TaxID=2676438 RepID=A0A844W408_9RHOB|nr:NUDIX hydrolase [Pseudooceanicola pacificus]MWB78946.1 DNA mismatch repair protein MutT [Pseudooceanicola pacificus]
MTDKTAIRNAATIIVLRDRETAPKVLMGQRGAKAVFMPNMFVFPGGAVDAGDAAIPLAGAIPDPCIGRLAEDSDPALVHALGVAAIRELWEETGQVLGRPGAWDGTPPEDWTGFAATGHLPDASSLQFVFRAITPPGRPRRFDARFFLTDAERLASDPDDFTAASDELSLLQWIPLEKAREFDLPFITEVVLAEVAQRAADPAPPASVPFFSNQDESREFRRLRGLVPLRGRPD